MSLNQNKVKIGQFKDWVIYEDDDYLAINKPPLIATLEDRESPINILELARKQNKSMSVCHRLDKETSGVLVLAKNEVAYKHLALQFENREVQKVYHCVSEGTELYENKLIDLGIKYTTKGFVRIDKKGKDSVTEINTLKRFKKHSLIEALPQTGRMHQIRAHMSAIGAPIVADEKYFGKKLYLSQLKKQYTLSKHELEERPLMGRVALHAFSIRFAKPNGKPILIEAPYYKDFGVLVKKLESYS